MKVTILFQKTKDPVLFELEQVEFNLPIFQLFLFQKKVKKNVVLALEKTVLLGRCLLLFVIKYHRIT